MKRYQTMWFFALLMLVFMAGCGGGTGTNNTTPNTITDTTAPTNTTQAGFINSGAASINSTAVTLAISATDSVGVTGYYTSESSATPSSSATGWTAVTSTTSYSSTSISFTLSSGDGTKTVYVFFKDAAGNVSASANDTITLSTSSSSDTTAPSNVASNFINSGASSTSSTTVTLAISATDSVGVTGYYASETSTTPSATATGWTSVTSTTSYSANVLFTLSNGDGTKTIYVWFKDAAGNVSAVASDTITLSTGAGNGNYTISGMVTLGGAGLSGVTMTLSGASSAAAMTDGNGNYTFSNLANGSYKVTPSNPVYVFSPVNKTVAINGASSVSNKFTSIIHTPTSIGSYLYNSGTGALSLNTTTSNFTCNGPMTGVTTGKTVSSLTAINMTWTGTIPTQTWVGTEGYPPPLTWSRTSGTAGDIVGTWTTSSSATGNSWTITFNSNRSYSMAGNISSCNSCMGNTTSLTVVNQFDLNSINDINLGQTTLDGRRPLALASDSTSIYLYQQPVNGGSGTAQIWMIDPSTGTTTNTYNLTLGSSIANQISNISDITWYNDALWATGGYVPSNFSLQSGAFRINFSTGFSELQIPFPTMGGGFDVTGLANDGTDFYVGSIFGCCTDDPNTAVNGYIKFNPSTPVTTTSSSAYTLGYRPNDMSYGAGYLWIKNGSDIWNIDYFNGRGNGSNVKKIDPSTGVVLNEYCGGGNDSLLYSNNLLWMLTDNNLTSYQAP